MSPAWRPRLPQLSARLRGIAQWVPKCHLVADIGCDHGILGLHLLSSGRCDHMVFSDISPASLQKARKLLAFHRLEHRATFLVADGAEALPEGVEAVVISGLGGQTIEAIIERGKARLKDARLILSPQTEAPRLRASLARMGFALEGEWVIRSNGRFYTAIAARISAEPVAYTPRELFIGHRLKAQEGVSLAEYFRWRLAVLSADRTAEPMHIRWLKEEIQVASGHPSNHL